MLFSDYLYFIYLLSKKKKKLLKTIIINFYLNYFNSYYKKH